MDSNATRSNGAWIGQVRIVSGDPITPMGTSRSLEPTLRDCHEIGNEVRNARKFNFGC